MDANTFRRFCSNNTAQYDKKASTQQSGDKAGNVGNETNLDWTHISDPWETFHNNLRAILVSG